MGTLEIIQGIVDLLAGLGEVTFQGISIYFLVRRVEEEKEDPPK